MRLNPIWFLCNIRHGVECIAVHSAKYLTLSTSQKDVKGSGSQGRSITAKHLHLWRKNKHSNDRAGARGDWNDEARYSKFCYGPNAYYYIKALVLATTLCFVICKVWLISKCIFTITFFYFKCIWTWFKTMFLIPYFFSI